jgi:hypothetical protein
MRVLLHMTKKKERDSSFDGLLRLATKKNRGPHSSPTQHASASFVRSTPYSHTYLVEQRHRQLRFPFGFSGSRGDLSFSIAINLCRDQSASAAELLASLLANFCLVLFWTTIDESRSNVSNHRPCGNSHLPFFFSLSGFLLGGLARHISIP